MDAGTIVIVAVGACLLCVVILILGLVLQVLGTIFDLIGGLFDMLFSLVNIGPIPGCGCVVVLIALVGCVGCAVYTTSIIGKCGTPEAVNFCRLLGY